jgi:hypothetical protein
VGDRNLTDWVSTKCCHGCVSPVWSSQRRRAFEPVSPAMLVQLTEKLNDAKSMCLSSVSICHGYLLTPNIENVSNDG